MTPTQWMSRVIKPAVFAACLVPLAWLLWDGFHHHLGANPIEKITHRTGGWALKFLLITLAITPLRRITGWNLIKRPYLTVGFIAFVLLIPLAVTSTNAMMRRLGSRWAQLHQLVYVIATLGVLHFLWLVKADVREPAVYGCTLAALLGWRVWRRRSETARRATPRVYAEINKEHAG